MAKIKQLYVYPIKSLPGISMPSLAFTPQGFEHDRTFMLIDERSNMVTLRDYAALAQFDVSFARVNALSVTHPGTGQVHFSLTTPAQGECEEVDVTIHGKQSKMALIGMEFDRYFTRALNMPVRLVRSVPWLIRSKHSEQLGADVPLYAQDGYPMMMLSEESLAELNRRLAARFRDPVTMARFRPNIVVAGDAAHAEDNLSVLWAGEGGEYEFKRPKLCSRCKAITAYVDGPLRGTFDPDNEPMITLGMYRRVYREQRDAKIYFGVNVVPTESGELICDMEVTL